MIVTVNRTLDRITLDSRHTPRHRLGGSPDGGQFASRLERGINRNIDRMEPAPASQPESPMPKEGK